MEYGELTRSYLDKQLERVEKVRTKISSRDMVVSPGRTIPDDADLVIGTGRRLSAAVLFIDICSFSSRLSNSLEEQERLLRLLNFFFTEMIAIVEDYCGVVEKNTGDGLMAYFEDRAGKPNENGGIRALSSALTMFYITEKAINPVIRASQMEEVKFRVGIEWGEITIAQMGRPKGFNSVVAVGTAANLASKMLNFGKENEIVVGSKLLTQVPQEWVKQWCTVVEEDSGFVWIAMGAPYKFFRYRGRWKDPITYQTLLEILAGKASIPPPPPIFLPSR